jgi:predicted nucleic-acid-binding protein
MKSIDTNVLMRILVDDPSNQKQCLIARQTVANLEKVYVSQVSQMELGWILKRDYSFAKNEIIALFEMLLMNSALELQNRNAFTKAIKFYRESTADFSDCIILAEAVEANAIPLITFDKKLAKLNHTIIPE